jgi:hypothetical protein
MIYNRIFTITLMLILPLAGIGQMYELPLADRVQDCQVIFEGKVISSESYHSDDKDMIFTAHLVDVYKVFKGSLTARQVKIVTQGGIVGDKMLVVTQSLELIPGYVGVFLARSAEFEHRPPGSAPRIPNSSGSSRSGSSSTSGSGSRVTTSTSATLAKPAVPVLKPFAGAQGFIAYDPGAAKATDPFYNYNDINRDVHTTISGIVGQPMRAIKAYDHYKMVRGNSARVTPSITSFTPDTITAGTRTVLTINGTGFGADTGSYNVWFRNANAGSGFVGMSTDYHVVSWSNTQIKLNVFTGAGSGKIKVTNGEGNISSESSDSIWILYNISNLSNDSLPDLAEDNGAGGYTFELNYEFAANEEAMEAFRRAINRWRCATKVNVDISSTLIADSCQSTGDGKNIVTFDDHCTLGGGTLGTAYSAYGGSGCGGPTVWYWNVTDMDIKFDASPSGGWYYGVDADSIGGANYDFESVAVHEFGHAHQLGHVINTNWVMHYSITNGEANRGLVDISDVHGGQHVMDRSLNDNPCGPDGIDSLTNDTITWNGDNSTYWWDGDNWTPEFVPEDCNVIYVPGTSTATNQPTIARDFAKCRAIEVQSSDNAEVTITDDGHLTIESPEPSP